MCSMPQAKRTNNRWTMPGMLDEVKVVTNQEINKAVAVKLGYEEYSEHPNQWWQNKRDPHLLPDYCTDIAAAWEVMEFMKTPGRSMELWGPMGDPHWVCRVYQGRDMLAGEGSETAPMAICLAFLKMGA